MRLIFTFFLSFILFGNVFSEDEFEKDAFLGAEGEGAIDGAIAFGYAKLGQLQSHTVGSETTSVVPGDQFEVGCDGASTAIGVIELPDRGKSPAEVNQNTFVMGDVVTLNLGCKGQQFKQSDRRKHL